LHQIAGKATDYREDVMTIAEQLEAKGEARGYPVRPTGWG